MRKLLQYLATSWELGLILAVWIFAALSLLVTLAIVACGILQGLYL
jgi:hypothetical protein